PASKTCTNDKHATRLTRKCIPESGAHIEEVRLAQIVLRQRVSAAQQVDGEHQRRRHTGPAKAKSGPELGEIGPGLPVGVDGEIPVDVKLQPQSAQRFKGSRRESQTI